jgi:hypothetical protein
LITRTGLAGFEAALGQHVLHLHARDRRAVARTVGQFGRNGGGETIAGRLAQHLVLETRNDIAVAVQIAQRLAAMGVFDLLIADTQAIVKSDDAVFIDRHAEVLVTVKMMGAVGMARRVGRARRFAAPRIL